MQMILDVSEDSERLDAEKPYVEYGIELAKGKPAESIRLILEEVVRDAPALGTGACRVGSEVGY
ncbi:MAG: hypothetical protein NVS1B2_26940 [Vulcanimicrobiaceae bacterium]